MNFYFRITVSQGLCLSMRVGDARMCFSTGSACLRPPAWHFHLLLGSSSPARPTPPTSQAAGLCLGLPPGTVRRAEGQASRTLLQRAGGLLRPTAGGHLDPGAPVCNRRPAQQEVVAAEPSEMSRAPALTAYHSRAWRESDASLEQLTQLPHLPATGPHSRASAEAPSSPSC